MSTATQFTPKDVERFYAKVSATATESGCIEWIAGTRNGYGHFNVRGKTLYAHRIAWEIAKGPIPHGLVVCHHCDNRLCVNIDHLFLGTKADNTHDMIAKNRAVHPPLFGERIGTSKLTASEVLEIRSDKFAGWTQSSIAKHFGVTKTLISAILKRRSWKHI